MFVALIGLSSCDGDYAQPPVILPEGGIGTGAWDNPMTAYQASLGTVNEAYPTPWVTGYIVGYVDVDVANVLKAESAKFTVPATVKTNILIAGNPDETNWENCVPVQLPSGPVRNALNLGDHPENLKVQVTIQGTTGSKYCSAYGVRSASAYNFGDKGLDNGSDNPSNPDIPSITGQTIYSGLSETATECDWTFDNVNLPLGISYIWQWKEYNNKYYLNGSAYAGGKSYAAEAYAISPVISLEGYTKAAFSFSHAAKFQTTVKQLCGAAVREAGTSEWTALSIPVWPDTTGWTFVESGSIDISAFAGKKVEIAFKYGSSADGADTWEIKNVKVVGSK